MSYRGARDTATTWPQLLGTCVLLLVAGIILIAIIVELGAL